MTDDASPAIRRRRYGVGATDAGARLHARRLLPLLIAQDGSTTRLCEAIAGGPITLRLVDQRVTTQVPAAVTAELAGSRFLERITSLSAHGEVMMDNLSYIALDRLPEDVQRDLLAGKLPIGHLLARLFVRRRFLPAVMDALLPRLWAAVGEPDPASSRAYVIASADGPAMLIAETFRDGMLGDVASTDARR